MMKEKKYFEQNETTKIGTIPIGETPTHRNNSNCINNHHRNINHLSRSNNINFI